MPTPIDLDTRAAFSWDFGHHFLLEVGDQDEQGDPLPSCEKYLWSDPEYGGDNTIRKLTEEQYEKLVKDQCESGGCFRWKGWHTIRGYCGSEVEFK